MIIFDWRQAEDAPWYRRFVDGVAPEWRGRIHGNTWWQTWVEARGRPGGRGIPGDRETPRSPGRPPRPLPYWPMVFISHRQNDVDVELALQAADWAEQRNVNVWLDVVNPTLNGLQSVSKEDRDGQWAIAVAGVIEVALVNATHVLVVRTKNTDGSTWIPYEYGRVADADTVGDGAACWLAQKIEGELPAYFHLGEVAESESALQDWLEEARRWSMPRA